MKDLVGHVCGLFADTKRFSLSVCLKLSNEAVPIFSFLETPGNFCGVVNIWWPLSVKCKARHAGMETIETLDWVCQAPA